MELQAPKCDSFRANKFAVCICSWVFTENEKIIPPYARLSPVHKKRHRAVFSEKLKQLGKKNKWMLMKHHWEASPPWSEQSFYEKQTSMTFERNTGARAAGFQSQIRFYTGFKELQTLLFQKILQQANSYLPIFNLDSVLTCFWATSFLQVWKTFPLKLPSINLWQTGNLIFTFLKHSIMEQKHLNIDGFCTSLFREQPGVSRRTGTKGTGAQAHIKDWDEQKAHVGLSDINRNEHQAAGEPGCF